MTAPPGNTGQPWLRSDLLPEERVEALLAEMTLAEKVGQTHQCANVDASADQELIRTGGIGSSRGEDVDSPASAIRDRLADNAIIDDGRFSDRTMHLVRLADITVAMVGEHPSRSGEAHSVANIGLPAGQLAVLQAIASLGEPLVVVVFTGRPLDLGEVLDLADAVLIAWHPGVEAGPALMETLFGDRTPGGRLPMTFPRSVGHLPSSSHARPTGRPIAAAEDPVTGRYLDALVLPRLPFGSG